MKCRKCAGQPVVQVSMNMCLLFGRALSVALRIFGSSAAVLISASAHLLSLAFLGLRLNSYCASHLLRPCQIACLTELLRLLDKGGGCSDWVVLSIVLGSIVGGIHLEDPSWCSIVSSLGALAVTHGNLLAAFAAFSWPSHGDDKVRSGAIYKLRDALGNRLHGEHKARTKSARALYTNSLTGDERRQLEADANDAVLDDVVARLVAVGAVGVAVDSGALPAQAVADAAAALPEEGVAEPAGLVVEEAPLDDSQASAAAPGAVVAGPDSAPGPGNAEAPAAPSQHSWRQRRENAVSLLRSHLVELGARAYAIVHVGEGRIAVKRKLTSIAREKWAMLSEEHQHRYLEGKALVTELEEPYFTSVRLDIPPP